MPSTYRSGRRLTLEGRRLVAGQSVGTTVLLHLGLEQVPLAVDQGLPGLALERLEGRVVAVVVLLDHLEAPAAGQDVAPDELALDPVGEVDLPGVPQLFDGFAERQVGGAATSVEGVEETTGLLDDLECLGQLAERVDRGVVDACGALVRGSGCAHRGITPTARRSPRPSRARTRSPRPAASPRH